MNNSLSYSITDKSQVSHTTLRFIVLVWFYKAHLSNKIAANSMLQNHLLREMIIASYIFSVAEYKKKSNMIHGINRVVDDSRYISLFL